MGWVEIRASGIQSSTRVRGFMNGFGTIEPYVLTGSFDLDRAVLDPETFVKERPGRLPADPPLLDVIDDQVDSQRVEIAADSPDMKIVNAHDSFKMP